MLEEYKLLRGEVENRAREQREMERNVVIIVAAVLVFLTSNGAPGAANAAGQASEAAKPVIFAGWLILPVVSFVGLARWLESLAIIQQLSIYMREYEARVVGRAGGWETHLHGWRKSGPSVKLVTLASFLFWIFMAVTTAGMTTWHMLVGRKTSPGQGAILGGIAAAFVVFVLIRQSKIIEGR